MVANYYGNGASLRDMRSKFRHSSRGITLRRLRDCAQQLGLQCRAVRVELHELGQLRAPAILHWELDHFVVLKNCTRKHIVILDPALGQRRLREAEATTKFTGVAMELAPTPAFSRAKASDSLKLSDFIPALRGLGRPLVVAFSMTLAVQMAAVFMPLQMQFVVDQGIRQGDMNLVTALALGFGLLSLISALVGYLRSLLLVYVGNTAAFRMVGGLAHHLMRLPDAWFESRHTGDVLSRFGSTAPVRQFLTTGGFAIVVDLLLAGGALVMLLLYSPSLTLAVCGFLVVFAVVNAALVRPLRDLSHESIATSALENSAFIENVQRHRAIRLLGAEVERGDAWGERYVLSINAGARLRRFNIHVGLLGSILGSIQGITLLLLCANEVIGGQFTLGMLFAFNAYSGMFSGRVNAIIGAIVGLRMLRLHLERISEIGLEELEVDLEQPGMQLELKGAIELKNVDFAFGEGEPYIFRNFNLSLSSGEFVAVMGDSGSGKSTLLKLLCGLLTPDGGDIFVDGIELRRIEKRDYRRQLGVVMQDDDLFSGTLLENIAVGEARPDLDRAIQAARLACIHEDISSMPMQYLTLVGQMGASLSGGQRQRVMIARAIYRNPRMFLLDEGTAHLNDELQQQVLDNVRSLGTTILWVTHDERVSDRADRCLDIAVESGIEESRETKVLATEV